MNQIGLNRVRRIVCAMSGGVDSSVSAALLKKKGYEVIGCFMRNWEKHEDDDSATKCSNDQDFDDANYVCEKLNIRLHAVDFIREYWMNVFEPFLNDYQDGLTPNPDILCNKHVKFRALINYCRERLDIQHLATGHYAQIEYDQSEKIKLMRGRDLKKDQSFFLCHMNADILPFVKFPVGSMLKSDVKRLAVEMNLDRIAQKGESMGLCFIGKRKFSKFISQYLPDQIGLIKSIETGKTIGQHLGMHYHTLGQRIVPINPRLKRSSPEPWYIAKKDQLQNIIYAAPGTNHPALFTRYFTTQIPHWIHQIPKTLKETGQYECDFRFQHKHHPLAVQVFLVEDGRLRVELPIPIRSICPGQYAVFYDHDEVLGAARIQDNGKSLYELKCTEPLVNSDLVLNMC